MKSTATETLLELMTCVQRAAERRELEDVALTLETELTGGDLSEHECEPIYYILDSLDTWLFATNEEYATKNPEMSTEEMWNAIRKAQITLDKVERKMSHATE